MGGKGKGKRMSKKVNVLLQSFFINGNSNPRDRMSAKEMQVELMRFVESGEIAQEDVPKVNTIQNWIGRFSRAFKDTANEQARQMLEIGKAGSSAGDTIVIENE